MHPRAPPAPPHPPLHPAPSPAPRTLPCTPHCPLEWSIRGQRADGRRHADGRDQASVPRVPGHGRPSHSHTHAPARRVSHLARPKSLRRTAAILSHWMPSVGLSSFGHASMQLVMVWQR